MSLASSHMQKLEGECHERRVQGDRQQQMADSDRRHWQDGDEVGDLPVVYDVLAQNFDANQGQRRDLQGTNGATASTIIPTMPTKANAMLNLKRRRTLGTSMKKLDTSASLEVALSRCQQMQ